MCVFINPCTSVFINPHPCMHLLYGCNFTPDERYSVLPVWVGVVFKGYGVVLLGCKHTLLCFSSVYIEHSRVCIYRNSLSVSSQW